MPEHECNCDECRKGRELEADGTSESEDCMTRGGGANGGGGRASRAGDKEVFVHFIHSHPVTKSSDPDVDSD